MTSPISGISLSPQHGGFLVRCYRHEVQKINVCLVEFNLKHPIVNEIMAATKNIILITGGMSSFEKGSLSVLRQKELTKDHSKRRHWL